MVNTLLFSLCLVVSILIWNKNPLIFRRRPFFFGLYILLDQKPTYFAAKTFFFGLHVFLVRKRVPPQNPVSGATIFSNASELKRVTNKLGPKLPATGAIFVILWQKIAILSFDAILITFRTFLKLYEKTKLLKFRS